MAKTEWISPDQLTAYLEGLGVASIPVGVTLQDEIDAAVAELHRAIGFTPYLASASSASDFNPPRTRTLFLGKPYQTITDVKIGKSASSAGSSLTDQVDYWPKPSAGPFTRIEFRDSQYGDPESIEVTGVAGVSTEIDARIWNAVRDMAAAGVYRAATMGGTAIGTPSEIEQGPVTLKLAGSGKESAAEQLETRAMAVFASITAPQVVGLAP